VKSLSLTEAFARYNAKLRNVRWAYSAIATDGSLVISCWDQYLSEKPGGILCYDVTDFSQWTSNPNGKKLLQQHLSQALKRGLRVRMVHVITADRKAVVAGVDGSKLEKTITVREELLGTVINLTSKRFTIDFKKSPPKSKGK